MNLKLAICKMFYHKSMFSWLKCNMQILANTFSHNDGFSADVYDKADDNNSSNSVTVHEEEEGVGVGGSAIYLLLLPRGRRWQCFTKFWHLDEVGGLPGNFSAWVDTSRTTMVLFCRGN